MARYWAMLMVLCVLHAGAMGASLKAGGLTSATATIRATGGTSISGDTVVSAGSAPAGTTAAGAAASHQQAMATYSQAMGNWDSQMAQFQRDMGVPLPQAKPHKLPTPTGDTSGQQQQKQQEVKYVQVGEGQTVTIADGKTTVQQQARRLAERSIKAADARITAYGGRSSGFDVSGNPVVNMNGMYQSSQGVVRARGGSTWGYDDLGQPYQGQDTDVTFDRRRLAERSIKAADARITAYGGRSSGFDVSGNPVVNMNGMYQSSQGVVRARGGSTWGYDDLGQPYQGQDTDVTFD